MTNRKPNAQQRVATIGGEVLKLKFNAPIKLSCRLKVNFFEIANCGNTQTVKLSKNFPHSAVQ
jgi:hypothetical protein